MNKNIYRVIFNAARRLWTVVQETATGNGRGRKLGTMRRAAIRVERWASIDMLSMRHVAYGFDEYIEGGAYFGFWCVEAVAAVKAFNLDDRLCLGLSHYPGDLLRPDGPTTHTDAGPTAPLKRSNLAPLVKVCSNASLEKSELTLLVELLLSRAPEMPPCNKRLSAQHTALRTVRLRP